MTVATPGIRPPATVLAALIPAHQVLDPVLIGEIHAGFARPGIASSHLHPPINPRHLVSLAAVTQGCKHALGGTRGERASIKDAGRMFY